MKEQEKYEILKDNGVLFFSEHEDDDFFEAIYEIDADTRWEQVETKDLVVNTDCELYTPSALHFAATKADTADTLVEDTLNNTGLTLEMYRRDYLLGSSAMKSLQDRAQISGRGLEKLTRDEYAYIMNVLLRNQCNTSKVMIRSGKVRFIASGDEKDYSVMQMSDLLTETWDCMNKHFGGAVFCGGHFEHTLTTARFALPNMAGKLLDVYTSAAQAHGVKGVENLVPVIQFASSDTGVGAAKISAMLKGGDIPVYIGSAEQINHRYGASVEREYRQALDGLYSSYRKKVQQLANLVEIDLSYPVNALKRLAKKFHLPRKEAATVAENMRMLFGDDPATAHDVYLGLQEILHLNSGNEKRAVSPTRRVIFEEDVAKCLTMRPHTWEEYDLAEGVEL